MSENEIEVAELYNKGLSVIEIAKELCILVEDVYALLVYAQANGLLTRSIVEAEYIPPKNTQNLSKKYGEKAK